jgi:inosose dehydratase
MTIQIGNAPCSWGVEFPNDPRNPAWRTVLAQCAEAGYTGIELGPVGFMPEDPAILADALDEHGLELIGGVVFRAFHDAACLGRCDGRLGAHLQGAGRPWREASGADRLDFAAPRAHRRTRRRGRADGPGRMVRLPRPHRHVAKMGAEEYGLTVGIHAHAAGFMDFEPELERLLDEVDEKILKICFDTGHHSYAGFDPVAFMKRHINRISYMHFKDIDPVVKADVIANRTGFLRCLRARHLLQSRRRRRGFSRCAPDPAGQRL